jgi:hypothetical protein
MDHDSDHEEELPGKGFPIPTDLTVDVICNGTVGTLYPATSRVHAIGKDMSAAQFEQLAGAGAAKKWKTSLRVLPGQEPECPKGIDFSACLPTLRVVTFSTITCSYTHFFKWLTILQHDCG